MLVGDLRTLGDKFALTPRPGSPAADAVAGASARVVVRGSLALDDRPFDAKFLGAIVQRDGLITPCQYTLSSVNHGAYEISVRADAEATGCGAPGAQIMLWASGPNGLLYTSESAPWPGNGGSTTFDASFSSVAPGGAEPPTSQFFGEVFGEDGERVPTGTRVEAYVGNVRCGVASTSRTGSFSGYVLYVVGPESVAGCDRQAY